MFFKASFIPELHESFNSAIGLLHFGQMSRGLFWTTFFCLSSLTFFFCVRFIILKVIFKFKEESSDEDVQKLNDAFNALPEAIPVIKDFEWGINDSPENFHQDFTHCYLVTFASEEDRDNVYTPHPQHQAFVKSLQPHLDKVFVVDYWTNP